MIFPTVPLLQVNSRNGHEEAAARYTYVSIHVYTYIYTYCSSIVHACICAYIYI